MLIFTDSGPISFWECAIFSILSIFILCIIGDFVIRLFRGKIDHLCENDLIQNLCLRLLMGIIILFVGIELGSLIGLKLFLISYSLVIISLFSFAIKMANPLKQRSFRFLKEASKLLKNRAFFIVILTFLVANLLSFSIITNRYGSLGGDAAFHTFVFRVILDNEEVSYTAQPYEGFLIWYGQAPHVIISALIVLVGVPIHKALILFQSILPGLVILAVYSSAKMLFKSSRNATLASIISFFSVYLWNPLGWGGLPFHMGMYLSIASIGLFYKILYTDILQTNNSKHLIQLASLFGLIIHLSIVTYPVSFFYIFLWFIVLTIASILKGKTTRWPLFIFICSLLIALALSSLYLHNALKVFYELPPPGQEGAISVTIKPIEETLELFRFPLWDFFKIEHFFSHFGPFLYLGAFSILLLPLCFFLRNKIAPSSKSRRLKNIEDVTILLWVYAFFIILYVQLTSSIVMRGIPLAAIFSVERIFFSFWFVPLFLTVLFISLTFISVRETYFLLAERKKNYRYAVFVAIILIFVITSGAQYPSTYRAFENPLYPILEVNSSLDRFAVLGPDDLALMEWISKNAPEDSRIFASFIDSGQYLAVVTQRKTIYSYTPSRYTAKYRDLLNLLVYWPSTIEAFSRLRDFQADYVYIGTRQAGFEADPYFGTSLPRLVPDRFIYSPLFRIEKQIGNAWLFELTEWTPKFIWRDENFSQNWNCTLGTFQNGILTTQNANVTVASAYHHFPSPIEIEQDTFLIVSVQAVISNSSFMIAVHDSNRDQDSGYYFVNPLAFINQTNFSSPIPEAAPVDVRTYIMKLDVNGIPKTVDNVAIYAVSNNTDVSSVKFSLIGFAK